MLKYVSGLTVSGFVLGILFWGGFNWSMELTNTESFCISCHEMQENVFVEYQTTIHYTNSTGVRATCPDCHVPKEWVHKVVRKVQATRELFYKISGSIDTPEKFNARRHILAQRVWTNMQATDTRECRNCHGTQFMALAEQSPIAKKLHELSMGWEKSCIDCHKGIAHQLPSNFSKSTEIDDWHEKLENENIPCYDCHTEMTKPDPDDGWSMTNKHF